MGDFDSDPYKADFLDRYFIYCDVMRVLLTLLEYTKFETPELCGKHKQGLISAVCALLPEVTYCLQQLEKDTRVKKS